MIIKENIITSGKRVCVRLRNNKPYWIIIVTDGLVTYWEKATIIG
jgi:hypothetical protein